MKMAEAIDGFLLSKKAENVSPCTIRAYRADLTDLAEFIGMDQGAEQISREIVRGLLALLHRSGSSRVTAVRKLSAVKSFASWLHGEGLLADDNFEKISAIKRPKLSETLPDVPSKEEIKILLDGGDFPTACPERDRLLLELMYGCGLRVSEAAKIRLQDLRPEQNAILINGKGGPYGKSSKFRLVPLNPKVREALDAYLPKRTEMATESGIEGHPLFFAVRDRYAGSEQRALNVRTVHRMVRHMAKVRGLQPMHPHLLRHACATHMLDNGCPLDVIAQILGHSNLDVTAHYTQVSTRLMMQSYNAAHPHAVEAKQPTA